MSVLHASNFRALRRLRCPLEGVSVLTGANGAGKTTVLLALKTLRAAFDRGLPQAVSALGGSHRLRHDAAAVDEPIELGLDLDRLSWRVQLRPQGSTVDHLTDERLSLGEETIFVRDSLGNFTYRGQRQQLSPTAAEQTGLRWVVDHHPQDDDAQRIANAIRGIHVFYDPDLRGLRDQGSPLEQGKYLHTHGRNVLTILRDWRDRLADRPRFDFVLIGMREAFPGVFWDIDFEMQSRTISAYIHRPGVDTPNPIAHEANGVLAMLLLLTAIAQMDRDGVLAIDEIEDSLHPSAIRQVLEYARRRARDHSFSALLTTHSPVLLDAFRGEPDRVLVLERGRDVLPIRLDEMYERDWLAGYLLGELYTAGQFATAEIG